MRLHDGLDHLERWSCGAGQSERNLVYEALFAVCECTVFSAYPTLDDRNAPGQLFVLVRNDLVVKVVLEDLRVFGLLYVGALQDAPGYDPGVGGWT